MPSKSNSRTRLNNAVPQPSMYSVYFSGAQARASSRRSSCLRPSNRSVRKSLPFRGQQIECKEARRVSTAKHKIFELWSATFVEGANFAVNHGSHIRQRV